MISTVLDIVPTNYAIDARLSDGEAVQHAGAAVSVEVERSLWQMNQT